MDKVGCIMGRAGDVAWFILRSDGTWVGGFSREVTAREVCEKHGGYLVKGEWFD